MDGDAEARAAMYARFNANCALGREIGGRSIIELDGQAGLLAVAAALGEHPGDEDDWYPDYLLGVAKDYGITDPWQTLQEASSADPHISAFLARVQAYRDRESTRRPHRDAEALSYADVNAYITGTSTAPLPVGLPQWGKIASDEDLRAAALDLQSETNPKRLRRYLRIFMRRPFPLKPDGLIRLVAHEDRLVSTPALHALMNVRHPDVRALALRLFETPDRLACQAVGMLVENYEPGDHARIEALAYQLTDYDALHSLGIRINGFYDAHPDADSEERVLRHLYENDPCSLCRGRIVLRLQKLGRLPDWMEEEVRYDADAGMYAELQKYRLELAGQKEAE
jgi:hypothetical protein